MPLIRPSPVAPIFTFSSDGWRLVLDCIDSVREYAMRTGLPVFNAPRAR